MFTGSGPGVQAPDGCSVEFYRRLPYIGELEAVREQLPRGGEVLELGCGTGRLTRKLIEWGLRPTSVDNSPEMLAELPGGAVPALADIENLRLTKRFDVAVLASCLINHPSDATRTRFLETTAHHLKAGGLLLAERHDPNWLATATVGLTSELGPMELRVESVNRTGNLVTMTLRYSDGADSWLHSFVTVSLSEEDIERLLSDCGFEHFAWLGAKRRWVAAKTRSDGAP